MNNFEMNSARNDRNFCNSKINKNSPNPEVRDTDGERTPLIDAVDSKWVSLDIVRCLVEHSANVNASYNKGKTPLWFDIVGDKPEVAQYLRARGATEPSMPCGVDCSLCCYNHCCCTLL